MKIIEQNDDKWVGVIDGTEVCEFKYYKDEAGDYWLNDASTEGGYRNQGLATQMIKSAIEKYGKVYFSSAGKGEHINKEPHLSRYLTTEFGLDDDDRPNGRSLVEGLIKNGIIPKEWLKNPFG